jgi:hypothetical protein
MTDRSAALEAAVRAQDKLIAEAQRLLKAYVETKRVHPDAVINDLLWLFDAPPPARDAAFGARCAGR